MPAFGLAVNDEPVPVPYWLFNVLRFVSAFEPFTSPALSVFSTALSAAETMPVIDVFVGVVS